MSETPPPKTLQRRHEDVWIRKKCYTGKTSLFGFPNVWETLIKDIFVWSWERADDCNKIDVFVRFLERADDCNKTLEIFLLNLKITHFKSRCSIHCYRRSMDIVA